MFKEEIVKTSKMKKENLIDRFSFKSQSNFDCAMNCINSSKIISKTSAEFECNIYFYDPHSRSCVLYEYDFDDNETDEKSKTSIKPTRRTNSFKSEAFDYFVDECEMDELIGDIVGYSKYCRRILGKNSIKLQKF